MTLRVTIPSSGRCLASDVLTAFDLIDGGMVSAVILTALAKRAHWAIPPVAGLALYHALGRWVAFQTDDPLPVLMVMQTLTTASFHFGLFLTTYGRLIGSLFALIGLSSAAGAWFGIVPQNSQGLALDLWNFQSAALHVIAVLMIAGIIDHDRAVARSGTAFRRS